MKLLRGGRPGIIKMPYPAHSLYMHLRQPTPQALESNVTVPARDFLDGIFCVYTEGNSETLPNSRGDQL